MEAFCRNYSPVNEFSLSETVPRLMPTSLVLHSTESVNRTPAICMCLNSTEFFGILLRSEIPRFFPHFTAAASAALPRA